MKDSSALCWRKPHLSRSRCLKHEVSDVGQVKHGGVLALQKQAVLVECDDSHVLGISGSVSILDGCGGAGS